MHVEILYGFIVSNIGLEVFSPIDKICDIWVINITRNSEKKKNMEMFLDTNKFYR